MMDIDALAYFAKQKLLFLYWRNKRGCSDAIPVPPISSEKEPLNWDGVPRLDSMISEWIRKELAHAGFSYTPVTVDFGYVTYEDNVIDEMSEEEFFDMNDTLDFTDYSTIRDILHYMADVGYSPLVSPEIYEILIEDDCKELCEQFEDVAMQFLCSDISSVNIAKVPEGWRLRLYIVPVYESRDYFELQDAFGYFTDFAVAKDFFLLLDKINTHAIA